MPNSEFWLQRQWEALKWDQVQACDWLNWISLYQKDTSSCNHGLSWSSNSLMVQAGLFFLLAISMTRREKYKKCTLTTVLKLSFEELCLSWVTSRCQDEAQICQASHSEARNCCDAEWGAVIIKLGKVWINFETFHWWLAGRLMAGPGMDWGERRRSSKWNLSGA